MGKGIPSPFLSIKGYKYMNMNEKLENVKDAAKELGITFKFDSEFKKMFIHNPAPGRQRIKAITDLSLESIKESFLWVAGSSEA